MPEIKDLLKEINVDSSMTLAVGWTVGRRTKIRQVILGEDVESAFRDVVRNTLSSLAVREAAAWTPDADLSPETFLVLDGEKLGEAPVLTTDHGDKSFLEVLSEAQRVDAIHPKHLPTGDLSFYAVVIGDPGQRSAFIRRSNPRRGLKRGRIYSTLSDVLTRVEEPIFAFDEWVDLVAVGGQVCVLSQTVFAAFFRDQETLAKKIPEWVQTLSSSVPLTDTTRQKLEERVVRDSRLKARLEAIVLRDHLASVSVDILREAMEANELDSSRILGADGKLTLEEDDIPQVLYLLNEDLFTGSLTNTGFRADKKASR